MRFIGVKFTRHFRAAFEPWAGQIHVACEPSINSPENLCFQNLGRKVYPL